MASCLPYPIPNPSRPGRESKGSTLASINHLSKVSLSSSGMEKKPKSKQTKGWLLFLTKKLRKGNWIPAPSTYKRFEDSRFENPKTNKIVFIHV